MRWTHWISLAAGGILVGLSATGAAAETGDVQAGQAIYSRCLACHALAYDRTGPRHCGLFGREAGSLPGFNYSEAMRNSNITWDEDTLNAFLEAPMEVIPGTAMGYAGISDPQERADLIAYLKHENASSTCEGK